MAKRRTPEERLRDERARFELELVKSARKQFKEAQLATYAGASKSRRNKDWKAGIGSADLAIIPDAQTLNARARQLVRDSWIAKSIVKAKSRNIVGKGITPIPSAHDENDNEYHDFNKTVERLFWDWASNRSLCDREARRTFWQFQTLAVDEKTTVGQSFFVWFYNPKKNGVGLEILAVEAEQLDYTIQNFEGNVVKGGIEVDGKGRTVAYHFYDRPPNDYLISRGLKSRRFEADRVLHVFRAERPGQTHGVTELAPVMQEIRDLHSLQNARLIRKRMEACIGFIVTKNYPTGLNVSPGLPAQNSDLSTASGMRAFDVAPGMVPELQPGEDVKPFIPSSDGADGAAFLEDGLRGIGAGVGLSYGAIARKSDGNYSSARQDMLEDEREIGPDQDLIIDQFVAAIYDLFVYFATLEGKTGIDVEELMADRTYFNADFIPPPRLWIDPEKEANGYAKLLEQRLAYRGELVSQRGGRFIQTIRKYAQEQKLAESLGVSLPENSSGMPKQQPQQQDQPSNLRKLSLEVLAEKSDTPPRYGEALSEIQSCATCKYLSANKCTAYQVETELSKVCDSWDGSSEPLPTGKAQPLGPQEGEKDADEQSARDTHDS